MPELIGLQEAHAKDRDKFQILAFHDTTVKSFAELDPKLAKIKAAYWHNKDLPFPVLLDPSGTTEKTYGIRGYPTGLLIDPQGKLVGEATVAELEAKLPPLPASQIWSRQRDMQKNVAWSFEPAQYTLSKLADIFQRWTSCPVGLDPAALQAAGLTADGPLPGVVVGLPITLRSIDELLLAPHGLGIAPTANDTRLIITKRRTEPGPESYLQRLRNTDLRGKLDGINLSGASGGQATLSIKNLPLIAAVKQISNEFDLPIALDAGAMRTRTLNPQAMVSGEISGTALQQSLTKMLDPLGLEMSVRHEVLLVMPKAH